MNVRTEITYAVWGATDEQFQQWLVEQSMFYGKPDSDEMIGVTRSVRTVKWNLSAPYDDNSKMVTAFHMPLLFDV